MANQGDWDDLKEVPNYPVLFRHMVLAIYLKGDLKRQRPAQSRNRIPIRSSPNRNNFDSTRFQAAMDVALAQLKKYGMIAETSSRADIRLTAYGRQTDNQHKREPASMAKSRRFDEYYQALVIEGRRRVSDKADLAELKSGTSKKS